MTKLKLKSFIRFPLKLIPSSTIMKVLWGANKGMNWIKGSGVNSYWIGNYEIDKQKALLKTLKKGMVFYDIGANVGFYTLLASRIVSKVVAFEPYKENIKYLKQNVALNNLKNVIIKPNAVSDVNGYVRFCDRGSSQGYVSDKGKSLVLSTTIDSLDPPDVVKIDVQGGIHKVLDGMKRTIKKYHPILFIAIDNGQREGTKNFTKKSIFKKLQDFGYRIYNLNYQLAQIENNEIIAKNGRIKINNGKIIND